jgi:hypothetical protein
VTTVDYQVSAGADDCNWQTGFYASNGTAIRLGRSLFGAYKIAARFAVTLPAGATITAAHVSLYITDIYGSPTADVYAEDAANPGAISSEEDGESRSLTTAKVAWSSYDRGWTDSPDISAVLSELLTDYSYAAGKALQIILVGTSARNNYVVARAQESAGNTYGPKLHIEYTESAGGYAHSQCIII